MVTLKLWSQDTMGRREKFIRYPSRKERKKIQKVVETFLYYKQAVNPTLLVALGSIEAEQAKGTTQTEDG